MTEGQIREKASIAYMKWLPKTHPEVIENEDGYEEYSNGLVEGWYGGYEIATKELQEENVKAKEIIKMIIELEPDSVYFCEDYKDEMKTRWYETISKAEAFIKEKEQ